MKGLGKIIGINLLVVLGYTIFSALLQEFLGSMMVLISLHVIFLFIGAIVLFFQKKSGTGGAFLLSALIVLVVGFSACLGGMSMLGGNFIH